VVDVGFDSDKHAQTRDDMKRGGGAPGGQTKWMEGGVLLYALFTNK